VSQSKQITAAHLALVRPAPRPLPIADWMPIDEQWARAVVKAGWVATLPEAREFVAKINVISAQVDAALSRGRHLRVVR
jgi:hypothetical protein